MTRFPREFLLDYHTAFDVSFYIGYSNLHPSYFGHRYTTHLKIIEFALANGLIFEAKRHVYFVQQLWKWQPSQHHSTKFCSIMEATKRNPKLNKQALQKLFRYYGEDLNDKDFF
jgi:hypothetical protein